MRTEQLLRPSRFIRREDLGPIESRLAIAGVLEEVVGTSLADTAWLLAFDGTPKRLLLTPATVAVLERAFGPDTDGWIGRRVVLWTDAWSLKLRPERRSRWHPMQSELPLDAAPVRGQVA